MKIMVDGKSIGEITRFAEVEVDGEFIPTLMPEPFPFVDHIPSVTFSVPSFDRERMERLNEFLRVTWWQSEFTRMVETMYGTG